MIEREKFWSPALRCLPDRICDSRVPSGEIQARVKQLLRDTKQEGGLPVDLTPIMTKVFVRKIERIKTSLGSGRLKREIGKDGGEYFVIVLKKGQTPEEERLIVAHEIGHALFYSREHGYFINHATNWLSSPFEHFCEMFARELLMPRELLEKETSKFAKPGEARFEANSLTKLANLFKVPTESMARRLVEDLGIWRAIIFQQEHTERFSPSWRCKLNWVVPFESEDAILEYSPLPTGLRESQIAMETISSKQRVFKLKIDLHELNSSSFWAYLPERIQQQIKEEEDEVLVFSSSNLDEGIQLPLFKWYELKSQRYGWFPYFCEIAQIVCVVPLRES